MSDQSPHFDHAAMVAGYASGVAGLLVGHPLDSLKVWIQTSSSSSAPSSSFPSSGTSHSSPSPQSQSWTFPSRSVPSMQSSSSTTTQNHRPLHLQSSQLIQRRYLLTADFAASARRRSAFAAAATQSAGVGTGTHPMVLNVPRAIRASYAGISTPMISVGLVQALNFALYDGFRSYFHSCSGARGAHRSEDTLWNVARSSAMAGGIVSVVTSPLVTLKIRQQITGWDLRRALYESCKQKGGIRNFYAGYPLHLFCDSVGRSLFFTTYEAIKRHLRTSPSDENHEITRVLSLPERMISATLAGMTAWSIVYPFDVVRTKLYAQNVTTNGTAGITEMILSIYRSQGTRAFFRGYWVTVARSGPVAAAALPVYDYVLEIVSKKD